VSGWVAAVLVVAVCYVDAAPFAPPWHRSWLWRIAALPVAVCVSDTGSTAAASAGMFLLAVCALGAYASALDIP